MSVLYDRTQWFFADSVKKYCVFYLKMLKIFWVSIDKFVICDIIYSEENYFLFRSAAVEKELREEAENCTLRELLCGVCRKDAGAFERLAEQYRSLTEAAVRRFAPSFGISGEAAADGPVCYALDDLRQYASMALYRAAETYSPDDKGDKVSFGLYAKVCVHNAMITELRKYRREQKRRAVREDGRKDSGEREKDRRRAEDPLCRMVSDESMRGMLEAFRSALSGYEKEVFEHYIIGKSVTEIAERLGKDTKSVSNAIYRMKVKIRGLLKT